MNYHNITTDDMLNGDGLRVVLWLSGCSHHCKNCQNPQTWDEYSGLNFTINERFEIMEKLKPDYISGITFSGGDPLHKNNRFGVLCLSTLIKRDYPDKTQWLYTGYTWEQIISDERLKECLKFIDVLVDGRFEEDKKQVSFPWAGSTNQRVIDVQRSLKEGKAILHGNDDRQ